MQIQEGYVYHVNDEYFEKVQDDKLMQNKENGTYRPTFFCMRDEKTFLLWMVPMSTRVEKFQAIYLDHIHTRNGNPVPVKHFIQLEVKSKLKQVRRLTARGIKIVFPDIPRLEKMMLEELVTSGFAE